MSNFKHSFKTKKTKTTSTKAEMFDFDFVFEGEFDLTFSVTRDFEQYELPKENKANVFITDRVRNPDLLISNIDKKEGIENLIIFASRINGCTYLDKADIIICKSGYKKFRALYIHAKIIIVNDFVILSSANLNKTNATIEQYIVINSKCLKTKITSQLKKKKL